MTIKNIGDATSISVVVVNWMDSLSTGLTILSTSLVIVWTVMRIVSEYPKFKATWRKLFP